MNRPAIMRPCAAMLAIVALSGTAFAGVTLHVSPAGRDENSGTAGTACPSAGRT